MAKQRRAISTGSPERDLALRQRWKQNPSPLSPLPELWRAKELVHQFTNRFVRLAGVTKLPCVCGRADDIEMHHPDYHEPLKVGFLCPKCHTAEHYGRLETPFIEWDLRDLAVADRVAFP